MELEPHDEVHLLDALGEEREHLGSCVPVVGVHPARRLPLAHLDELANPLHVEPLRAFGSHGHRGCQPSPLHRWIVRSSLPMACASCSRAIWPSGGARRVATVPSEVPPT